MKRSIGKDSVSEKVIPASKRVAHWSKGLLESMEDPSVIVTSDDQTVMIRDKYPKAKHHYLILPREDIPSLRALDSSHGPLLIHMLKVARDCFSTDRIQVRFSVWFSCVSQHGPTAHACY